MKCYRFELREEMCSHCDVEGNCGIEQCWGYGSNCEEYTNECGVRERAFPAQMNQPEGAALLNVGSDGLEDFSDE